MKQHTVDITPEKYLGMWYQIANIPAAFDRQCTGGSKAEYLPIKDSTEIKVVNTCLLPGNQTFSITGTATPVGCGKFYVSFGENNLPLPPDVIEFEKKYGNYWILQVGDGSTAYTWSLVGSPDKKFLYILSRTPKLKKKLVKSLVEYAEKLGYDVSKLRFYTYA